MPGIISRYSYKRMHELLWPFSVSVELSLRTETKLKWITDHVIKGLLIRSLEEGRPVERLPIKLETN